MAKFRSILSVHIVPLSLIEERIREAEGDAFLQRFEEMMESTLPTAEDIENYTSELRELFPVLH